MKIRRFRRGDEEGVIKLIGRVMSEFDEYYDPVLDRDLRDIPKYYGNKGAFWVLLDGDHLVGCIGVSRVTDEICKFRRFYIDKGYRGKGWGSKMFDLRMKFAVSLGYKTAWMVTSSGHKDAIKFVKEKGARRSIKRLFPTKRAQMFFIYDL